MATLISLALESLRMLSFLTVLGAGMLGTLSLTGCDQPPSDDPTPTTTDPDPDTPLDPPEKSNISIDAPGVDIEIDRTPGVDGERDVDIDLNRDPIGEREVDVDVDPN